MIRVLDLFCGAGGACYGYQQAGFSVVGVDKRRILNYLGSKIIKADALEYLKDHWKEYDLIHASPPCQRFSVMTRRHGTQNSHPDLIRLLRMLLWRLKCHYVIENVPAAPLLHPIILCGSMFNLPLRRHRLFECSFSVPQPPCQHASQPEIIGVYGHTGGKSGRDNLIFATLAARQHAMGIDWMTAAQLSQAVPPAYTAYIAQYFPV